MGNLFLKKGQAGKSQAESENPSTLGTEQQPELTPKRLDTPGNAEGVADGSGRYPSKPAGGAAHTIELSHSRRRDCGRSGSRLGYSEKALEAAHLATFSWNPGDDVITMDDPMVRMMRRGSRPVPNTLDLLMEAIHTDDRAPFRAQLKACAIHQTDFNARFRLLDESRQSSTWTDCSGKPLSLSTSGHVHVLCMCRPSTVDASAAQSEGSDNRKIARAAHEIRTPVAGILGLSQLLIEDQNLTDTQRERLKIMIDNGKDLLQTLNDILANSRQPDAASTEQHDRHQPLSLSGFMTELVELFRVVNKNRRVDIEFDLVSEDTNFRVDRVRLRRILINLMGNALKFTEKGKVILVGGWSITDADGTADLRFEVVDTGVGIESSQLCNIFQPYQQLDYGKTKDGIGLGLSISRDLVRQLGGKLGVESQPGRGSTFSLTIPVELKSQSPSESSIKQTKAILVGSDKASNQAIVHTLKATGFETRWHTDVAPGDLPFFRHHLGPVIVDCSDPAFGISVLDWVRASVPADNSNITAVCGALTESQARRLLDAGATGLLTRPFSDTDLEAAVSGEIKGTQNQAPSHSKDPVKEGQDPGNQVNPDELEGLIDQLEAVGLSLADENKGKDSMLAADPTSEGHNWKGKFN